MGQTGSKNGKRAHNPIHMLVALPPVLQRRKFFPSYKAQASKVKATMTMANGSTAKAGLKSSTTKGKAGKRFPDHAESCNAEILHPITLRMVGESRSPTNRP